MSQHHSFFKRNGLLIVFLSVTVITLIAQTVTGWHEFNAQMLEKGKPAYAFTQYLGSGHFLQATFENWESEFLQMGVYVYMTMFLYQRGSAESKSLDKPNAVDKEPVAHANAPWPVKRGGLVLTLYKNSLSLVFLLLFCISFALHAYGTMKDINTLGDEYLSYWQVFTHNRLWFESLQNWQSEFLSVASIVFFSIYLRQQGSPESKPVDTPHDTTGG